MKSMFKSLAVLLLALMPVLASAQDNKFFKPIMTITEIEINDGALTLSVFSMPEDGQDHYFVSLGTLGIGDDIIQVNIDPVSELYIPLGDTLEEAQAKLEEIKDITKQPVGASMETLGTLSAGYPDKDRETVVVTHRKPLLQHLIEFAIHRNGYIRATYISKSEFGSLVSGVKFYRKLHPKEK